VRSAALSDARRAGSGGTTRGRGDILGSDRSLAWHPSREGSAHTTMTEAGMLAMASLTGGVRSPGRGDILGSDRSPGGDEV